MTNFQWSKIAPRAAWFGWTRKAVMLNVLEWKICPLTRTCRRCGFSDHSYVLSMLSPYRLVGGEWYTPIKSSQGERCTLTNSLCPSCKKRRQHLFSSVIIVCPVLSLFSSSIDCRPHVAAAYIASPSISSGNSCCCQRTDKDYAST